MSVLRVSPGRRRGLAALVAAAIVSTGLWLNAQVIPPVLNPPQVLGPNVTFTWSSVPSATSYILQAGLAPGQYILGQDLGNVTAFGIQAPAVGTYFARVVAVTPTGQVPSNEVPIVITTLFVPPAAPTNLTGYVNGQSVLLTWDLGTGGGAPTSLVLYAGSTPGGSELGAFPVAVGTQMGVPSVGAGTYYLRMVAVNAGGASPVSNEAELVMPVGGGCSAPPAREFNTVAFGRYVQFDWAPVPGAAGYILNFTTSPGAPPVQQVPVAGNASRYSVSGAPLGTFYGSMTTAFSCGSQTAGPEKAFTLDGAPPPGPRTPDPAPGQRLPLPNMYGMVQQLAAQRADLLFQSCVEHGGNNRFMYELVRRLRAVDNRWGLNWKRGNRGDMSQDVVDYNYGSESDEDTTRVYIIDVIGGHCGPRPSAAWFDVTQATVDAGSVGRWTLMPYLNAGYPIVSDPQQ